MPDTMMCLSQRGTHLGNQIILVYCPWEKNKKKEKKARTWVNRKEPGFVRVVPELEDGKALLELLFQVSFMVLGYMVVLLYFWVWVSLRDRKERGRDREGIGSQRVRCDQLHCLSFIGGEEKKKHALSLLKSNLILIFEVVTWRQQITLV